MQQSSSSPQSPRKKEEEEHRRGNKDIAAQPQSHRIYWQQRLSGSSSSSSENSNNNLITGSAAVKISHSAKACDLTNLLRKTLHLGSSDNDGASSGGKNTTTSKDSLVLVGTLRSVPTDYVRFEHEQELYSSQSNGQELNDASNQSSSSGSSRMEDFHVVKTLDAEDPCLSVLQDMKAHLLERQRAMDHNISKAREEASPTRRSVLSLRPTIAPQTRWYYVPDTTTNSPSKQQPTMSSCLELDGYLTSFDEEEDIDDEEDSNSENDTEANGGMGGGSEAVYGDDEDLLRRALAPFDDDSDEDKDESEPKNSIEIITTREAKKCKANKRRRPRATPTAEKTAREWRRYLQISQSHAAAAAAASSSDKTNTSSSTTNPSNSTLAGFLLKRSSKDPHVWKRHYCVLTQDDFWYVPRVVRSDEFLPSEEEKSSRILHPDNNDSLGFQIRTIAIAQTHGRLSLADATLLGPSQTTNSRRDGFELVGGGGRTHTFRACSPTVSAGAATQASIALAREWKRMLRIRIRDAMENSLTKHAELLVTEETVARNDRWRNFLVTGDDNDNEISSLRKNGAGSVVYSGNNNNNEDNDSDSGDVHGSSLLRSSVLHFGLDVAEYKEGCRQIQTLLWVEMAGPPSTPSSSSAAMGAIRKHVKELWREASFLLDRAVHLNVAIAGNSGSSSSTSSTSPTNSNHHIRRGLETLCHHVEYVITQKRRRPSRSSIKESSSNESLGGTTTSSEALDAGGDRKHPITTRDDYPHHRDPPPIDLFDLLWNELRTLG
jgi:hypothetical protein